MLAAPLPLTSHCPQAGKIWQLKFHWSHPTTERSRGKTGRPTHLPSSSLFFHWAGLGHMPSPIPITGKGNKITGRNYTSHDLFLAGSGTIFPCVTWGKDQFFNKIGVLLGRKKEEAEWLLGNIHHRGLVVRVEHYQRQTTHSTHSFESLHTHSDMFFTISQ